MVQSAKNRMRNDVSEPLDLARVGRVLPERNVSSHVIIIGGIFRKNSSKALCVEHDQMISALCLQAIEFACLVGVLGAPGLTGSSQLHNEPQTHQPARGDWALVACICYCVRCDLRLNMKKKYPART